MGAECFERHLSGTKFKLVWTVCGERNGGGDGGWGRSVYSVWLALNSRDAI